MSNSKLSSFSRLALFIVNLPPGKKLWFDSLYLTPTSTSPVTVILESSMSNLLPNNGFPPGPVAFSPKPLINARWRVSCMSKKSSVLTPLSSLKLAKNAFDTPLDVGLRFIENLLPSK